MSGEETTDCWFDEPRAADRRSWAVPPGHGIYRGLVANQLLAGDPPETWQAVQRLAGMGYDWHNIMHMIASLVTEDVYQALIEHRQPDPASYARRLTGLPPGDWPPPEPAGEGQRRPAGHPAIVERELAAACRPDRVEG